MCDSEDDTTKNLALSRKQFLKIRSSDMGNKARCHTIGHEQSYLPKLLSLVQSLQGFSHATAIDISMGYYNVPIGEESRKYHNERLPMSVAISPGTIVTKTLTKESRKSEKLLLWTMTQ